MKKCTKCGQLLSLECFAKDSQKKDGHYSSCKECNRSRVLDWHKENPEKVKANIKRWAERNRSKCNTHLAKYRASKFRAIPPWYESEMVKTIYKKAKELGLAVDHIVPLNSKEVCGLHCWHNLQLLAKTDNSSKSNRYWPDMPEEAYGQSST